MDKETRCIHEMLEGTCALCEGHKQTQYIGTGAPTYIQENSFYRLYQPNGALATGADKRDDYNWDEWYGPRTKRNNMSLPITPTPILKGQDAERFLTRIKEQEDIPVYLVPTPKLDLALKEIRWKIRKMRLAVLKAQTEILNEPRTKRNNPLQP